MSKTFRELEISPIRGIELINRTEEGFKDRIKTGDNILFIDQGAINSAVNLEDAEKLHKWLEDVFEYIKVNKPKYTFHEAINYMKKGKKASFKGIVYFLDDESELVTGNKHEYYDATVSLDMLELQEWELL